MPSADAYQDPPLPRSTVYLVTDEVAGLLSYWVRGWTSFEYLLSMLIKVSNESALSDWHQVLVAGPCAASAHALHVPCMFMHCWEVGSGGRHLLL